ncbi:hypothetical protein C0W96_09520 [Photobacterium kishitanii]|uniref:hypothetical protein n=1 Tax=Photobacterium kishitanii TaxID=318456 RepID=UPI000D150FBF|nr:hypothetical protein [Photobacterium kishitanii]PSV06286.1 hypothetical protein C0W96_09520 [Photobacterium kishitanii]PSV76612.1 hypothetical protein C0W29_06695 [Photobacterium kishitanii]
MFEFKNKLSQNQKTRIQQCLGIKGECLDMFYLNIEHQLNVFGKIPTNEKGDIDFYQYDQCIPKECVESLKEINKKLGQLRIQIERYNSKAYTPLSVNLHDLSLSQTREVEMYGYINSIDLIDSIISSVNSDSSYYQPMTRGKSSNMVGLIFHAWWFSLGSYNQWDIKLSDSNPFINVVSIVTSWDIDTAKKNVKNSTIYKIQFSKQNKGNNL